jgi:hypothetical protein
MASMMSRLIKKARRHSAIVGLRAGDVIEFPILAINVVIVLTLQ